MRFPGFVGGSYQMRSITTDCQRCINLYPDIDEMTTSGQGAKAPPTAKEAEIGALLGTPGLRLLQELPTLPVRGVWAVRNYSRVFAVSGNKFYELVNSGGVYSEIELGTLLTSSGPVGISDNGIQICIVDGANGYSYTLLENSILPAAYDFTAFAPANATAGATYTNNAQTFTVLYDIALSTLLQTTGTGDPLASDVLTLASGTGDATIAYASFSITSQMPWMANTAYAIGDTIIPTVGGYIYTAIVAGTTSNFPPNFPTTRFSTVYDGSVIWQRSSSFMQIKDPAFLGSNVITYQDGYFFFAKPNTNQLYCSDVFATTFNGLNFVNLEGSTAPILNLVSMHRQLYVQTTETTEIYYDAGVSPGFPFSRINGGYLDQGLAAQFSLAQTANAIFWLGQDRSGNNIVYTTSTFLPQRISTFPVEEQLEEYETTADAIGYTYTEGGHSFYVLNFPTAQKTWCYDISTGFWHERAYNQNGNLVMQLGVYHQFGFGIHIMGSYADGKIYEMSQDIFTDNGTVIIRKRIAPHLAKDMVRMFYSSLQLDIQQGVGLDGIQQGDNPICMLRFSDDGARTWSNIKDAGIGKIGEYKKRAIFWRLGYARDRVFEITISDPVFVALVGAEIYMDSGNS